ncbi:hypothetical protein TRICI_002704 [Trichomonascus ciferrii]|uniref:UBC core domain-containing protein n=1 Tax=Trichomonascus ciferrii TaxID=44093 RepID=A0A642V614_9ASCO|nr:hypothetical protein TRICI_002704 [Trichomonascus ciferrii]
MASKTARLRKDIQKLVKECPADVVLPESFGDGVDLTNLSLYILGPESTAYSEGAWKISLKVPADYPSSPPKAFFNTKIFHPNVQPSTGEVCVDTLKRDWTSEVDLNHIMLTIRCLLIQPNPDSSLNEEAGKLIQEDFLSFERTAKLMTKVHALDRASVAQLGAYGENIDSMHTETKTSASITNSREVLQPISEGQQAKTTISSITPGPPKEKKRKTGLKRL